MGPYTHIFLNILIGLFCYSLLSKVDASFPYYGTKIGPLTRLHHGVSGDVYAVDSRTLFIKNFNYDGEAPAAYFYVGNTPKPSNKGGHRLRDERGGTTALTRRYRNKDITLSLPDGKTLRDIKWFSVWCDEFAVNFGDVSIPSDLDFPRPQKISSLKGVHGVSSDNIVIVDAQTLLIPNFSYDGEAPDAKFWVGRGQRPSPQGLRIPDENGKENPLRRYERKTIVLTLPEDLTIFDIGHFGVWCEAFTVDFGHVRIPEGLNVPPSLKMLGISPQSRLNCEVLYDDLAFEVRWAVAGESIVIQLIAKLDFNEYMAFGVSKSPDKSVMIGSDAVVAWVEKDTGKGFAIDYHLGDKSQCSGGRGVCPKVKIENGTSSIRLLNAAWVNGYSIVTYQRSLQINSKYDVPIIMNISQAIVWGIGPLNERNEASYHTHYTRFSTHIDFGRQPIWNCPSPEGSKEDDDIYEENTNKNNQNSDFQGYAPAKAEISISTTSQNNDDAEEEFYENNPQALHSPNRRQGDRQPLNQAVQRPHLAERPIPTPKPASTSGAWDIPAINCYEPEDGVFYAQMGPTGGKHGYSAITGHVGWGISWYINGLLIPEIHVVRGKTYTFVVEGGTDVDTPAKYHPFYITDDPIGGYEHKREEEKRDVRIFAGVQRSRTGQLTPTGVGRLCNWTPDVDGQPADDYQSFGAYQRTLTLKCEPGEPGVITWTPDHNTPDTVYYQCFTHRYLGWKIHVHDSCDKSGIIASPSQRQEVRVPYSPIGGDSDITAEASTRHENKVSPNDNFLLKHQTNLIKNHNMNGTPPKFTFELTKSSEITKLISDGIRAAEALEESILKTNNQNNTSKSTVNNYNINHNKIEAATQGILTAKQKPHPSNAKPINTNTGGATIGGPYISTAVPEILHGENNIHPSHIGQQIFAHTYSQIPLSSTSTSPPPPYHLHDHFQQAKHHQHVNNFTNLPVYSQKPISLSEYLRPPQSAVIFNPVKLPGHRPYPRPIKKVSNNNKAFLLQQSQRRPLLPIQPLPQPSVLISHYRKPFPGMLKPFFKEKPFPRQPIAASVLLPDLQTSLGGKSKSNSLIPVPYSDTIPQESIKEISVLNKGNKHEIKPYNSIFHEKFVSTSSPTQPNLLEQKLDDKEIESNKTLLEISTIKSSLYNGFKPDSVVVESGFRPIIRKDKATQSPTIDQMAHRREDPGSEIDEAMETDTLFLTAQKETQAQHFEPMFIPSPPDSTNATINILNALLPSTILDHDEADSHISAKFPTAAKLRNETMDEILADNYDEATNKFDDVVTELPTREQNQTDSSKETPELFKEDELSIADELDDEDEREAQAAERIDTYYLPPDNRKIPHASLPSGAVVTFDGKSIVDGNLVLPPKFKISDDVGSQRQAHSISQIEELIRSTPQIRPFQGELPQPVAEFLSKERTRNKKTGTGVGGVVGGIASGGAGSYLPPTSLSPPRVHSTKLQKLQ